MCEGFYKDHVVLEPIIFWDVVPNRLMCIIFWGVISGTSITFRHILRHQHLHIIRAQIRSQFTLGI